MRRLILPFLVLALVAGCAGGPGASPTTIPGTPQPEAPSPAPATPGPDGMTVAAVDAPRLATSAGDATAGGEAVNAFGLELYARLAADDPTGNLVVSPASIALALAMARAGARGVTADEMDRVLHGLGADAGAGWVAALDQAFLAANERVTGPDGTPLDVVLRSVNAPFAQAGLPLEPAYLRALAERFAAGLRLVDYVADPEGSRGMINGWVADQTEQRIPELLAHGIVTPDTRLVLVNAIYLNAPWLVPFSEGRTEDAPFTRLDGSTMDVPMMLREEPTAYAAGDGWQAVELPYLGRRLAMLVILPDDLAAFEGELDAARLDAITGALEGRQIGLRMPSFGTESKLGLNDALIALGMPTAFSGSADFSGITTRANLFISNVVHQANIDVDERGTEAAAATAVVIALSAAGPEIEIALTIDHPFLFALRDLETGAILFLGRVTEPGPADPTSSGS